MNVFELPFNKFIGLKPAEVSGYLLMLGDRVEYYNHLNTVHASALFALAEATSGFYLLDEFKEVDNVFPVVRKVETKYKKPVQGCVYSKAKFVDTTKLNFVEELNLKQRGLITVRVMLFDSEGGIIMQSDFEWFVAKK